MTLDRILGLARSVERVYRDEGAPMAIELARGIINMLGEAQPCGEEPPEIVVRIGERLVRLPETWPRWMTPSEARAHAAMLLRAADEADGS